MRKIIAICIGTLILGGCTTTTSYSDKIIKNAPADGIKGIKVGTISRKEMKDLGLDSDRAFLGGVSGTDLFFIGIDGESFDFDPKEPKGKLVTQFTIKVYQKSPNCYFIKPGDGTGFWYPWGCP